MNSQCPDFDLTKHQKDFLIKYGYIELNEWRFFHYKDTRLLRPNCIYNRTHEYDFYYVGNTQQEIPWP